MSGIRYAGSPGEVCLRRTGDIFRRLVPSNPAGVASSGRDQSAGYARRSHSDAIADVGSIPTVSTPMNQGQKVSADSHAKGEFVPAQLDALKQLDLRSA